jgi:protein-tyrosine phosphatase
MAEAVFQTMVKARDLDAYLFCDSAGTGDYHIGSLPHPGTLETLRNAGITTKHHARQLSRNDFTLFQYILVMDRDNLRDSLAVANGPAAIKLVMEYSAKHTDCDVPDPYFDGRFNTVFEMVSDACSGFLDEFERNLVPTESTNG